MGLLKEFKEFAIKGNAVELAVAVVLGAAFGRVVSGVTDALIAPILALVVGKVSVGDIKLTLVNTVFPIGVLLQSIIDFIMIALVTFITIKAMNTLYRKKETQAAEAPSPKYTLTEQLLMDIRDNFKDGNSKKTDINV